MPINRVRFCQYHRKCFYRGSNTVQLSAAMVRDDHSVELQGRGLPRIVRIQNALEYDRSIAVAAYELEILPVFLPSSGAMLPS